MAWKARVVKKTADYVAQNLTLDVEYFDAADPALVLARRQHSFPAGATGAEVATSIKLAGASEKRAREAVGALDAQITVGQEITI